MNTIEDRIWILIQIGSMVISAILGYYFGKWVFKKRNENED